MDRRNKHLGKRIAAYGIAPAYLQRALFISLLSLLFFLAMMAGYYIRQSGGYFLLATGFLIVYLVTFISWVLRRRSVASIYENGIEFNGRMVVWSEIESLDSKGTIIIPNLKPIILPATLEDRENVCNMIRKHLT